MVDLMPPGVKTDLTTEMQQAEGIALMSTDELIKQSFAGSRAGKLEICPGQSNLLAWMRRLAPDCINRQLWKASKKLVPVSAIQ